VSDQPAVPPFPAPWRVDGYTTHDGRTVWSVRSADHGMIIQPGDHEAFCRAVVRSRNEGTVEADVEAVRTRYQAALDRCHAETDRLREKWHEESGKLIDTNYRLQLKLLTLRERFGVLEPGDKPLLKALREDLNSTAKPLDLPLD
jgi:hypothetical protein